MVHESVSHTVEYGLVTALASVLLERNMRCAVAESCTGGSLSAMMTEVPGSSEWFDRGFITYSNAAKEAMLGVSPQIIAVKGAVSEATARAMAEGVIAHSNADVSVAITGLAGPGGGRPGKPVGTVWIAWAGDWQPTESIGYTFKGDRVAVRRQAVCEALKGLIKRCKRETHPRLNHRQPDRFFFALYPDPKTAEALQDIAQKVLASSDCKPVPIENLHLTLHYLGALYPALLDEVRRIAKTLMLPSFTLRLDELACWEKPKICCLNIASAPKALLELAKCLNQVFIPAGCIPEHRPYVPHVTLARAWTLPCDTHPIPPVSWPVNAFYLLKSHAIHESTYDIVESWPLQ